MNFNELTADGLLYVAAVILALVVAYNTIMGAIKTHREEKQRREAPMDDVSERLKAHDKMLAKDKERLDKMDEQSIIMLRAVRALLSHEVNGNSIDKLRDSMAEIDDYLISRR